MPDLNWTGGDVTRKNLAGVSWFNYSSDNWVVWMYKPLLPFQLYDISANYTSPTITFRWTGGFMSGFNTFNGVTYNATVTQKAYLYKPAPLT